MLFIGCLYVAVDKTRWS